MRGMEAIRFNVSGRREMRNRYDLAYEFVKQGIWDEWDFVGFMLDESRNQYKSWRKFR